MCMRKCACVCVYECLTVSLCVRAGVGYITTRSQVYLCI